MTTTGDQLRLGNPVTFPEDEEQRVQSTLRLGTPVTFPDDDKPTGIRLGKPLYIPEPGVDQPLGYEQKAAHDAERAKVPFRVKAFESIGNLIKEEGIPLVMGTLKFGGMVLSPVGAGRAPGAGRDPVQNLKSFAEGSARAATDTTNLVKNVGSSTWDKLGGFTEEEERRREYKRYVDDWWYNQARQEGVLSQYFPEAFDVTKLDPDVIKFGEYAGDPGMMVEFGAGKLVNLGLKAGWMKPSNVFLRQIGGPQGATSTILRQSARATGKGAQATGWAMKKGVDLTAWATSWPKRIMRRLIDAEATGKTTLIKHLGKPAEALQHLGRIASQPATQKRFLARVVADPDAPEWVRDIAAFANRHGGQEMMAFAMDSAAGGLKVGAIQAALTAAAGAEPEDVLSAGLGGVMFGAGAGTVSGNRMMGTNPRTRAKGSFSQYEKTIFDRAQKRRLKNLPEPFQLAVGGFYEAGIPVNPVLFTEKQMRKWAEFSGKPIEGRAPAGLATGDERGTFLINTDAPKDMQMTAFLHEGGHNVAEKLIQTDPNLIHAVLGYDPDSQIKLTDENKKEILPGKWTQEFIKDYNSKNPDITLGSDAKSVAHEIIAENIAAIMAGDLNLTTPGAAGVALKATEAIFSSLGLVDPETGLPLKTYTPISKKIGGMGVVKAALQRYNDARMGWRNHKATLEDKAASVTPFKGESYSEAAARILPQGEAAPITELAAWSNMPIGKIVKNFFGEVPRMPEGFAGHGKGKEGPRIHPELLKLMNLGPRIDGLVKHIETMIANARSVQFVYSNRTTRKGNNPLQNRTVVPFGFQITKAGNINVMGWDQTRLFAFVEDLKTKGYIKSVDGFLKQIDEATKRQINGEPINDERVAAVFGADPDFITDKRWKEVAERARGGSRIIRSFRLDGLQRFYDTGERGLGTTYQDAKYNRRPMNMPRPHPGNTDMSLLAPGRVDDQGTYSVLERTIQDKIPNRATPEQILATLQKAGVKPEEMKWAQINPETLSAHTVDGKVDKETLLHLARRNAPQFKEEILTGDSAVHEQWKVPGGEDYKERVLNRADTKGKRYSGHVTLPDNEAAMDFIGDVGLAGYNNLDYGRSDQTTSFGVRVDFNDIPETAWRDIENMARGYGAGFSMNSTEGKGPTAYTSTHYQTSPDYVAHSRSTSRTTKDGKGHFIEEIQSDRHQEGRKKGYQGDFGELDKQRQKLVDQFKDQAGRAEVVKENNLYKAINEEGGYLAAFGFTPEEAKQSLQYQLARRLPEFEKITERMEGMGDGKEVPDAPFRKDWGVQMFKRELRDAVQAGKDWIGWASGKTNAGHYNLSKQVNEIAIARSVDTPGNRVVFIDTVDGQTPSMSVNDKGIVTASSLNGTEGKPLSDVVGKELAKDLMEHPLKDNDDMYRIKGPDLDVGGEGMKGFYDKILPKEIGKYVKKMGGKVEVRNLDNELFAAKDMPIELSMNQAKAVIKARQDNVMSNVYRDADPLTPRNVERWWWDTSESERANLWSQMKRKSGEPYWHVQITDKMRQEVQEKGQPRYHPGSASDETYKKAIRSGDTATAARVLKDVAAAKGYNYGPLFRGHARGYGAHESTLAIPTFTDSHAVADVYSGGDTVSQAFVRMSNPLKLGDEWGAVGLAEAHDLVSKWGASQNLHDIINYYSIDPETGSAARSDSNPDDVYVHAYSLSDLPEFVKLAKEQGYDGVIHSGNFTSGEQIRDGLDIGSYSAIEDMAMEYRPFSVKQIKSASPTVLDDKGNLILPSKRFDKSSPDFRFHPGSVNTDTPEFKKWFGNSKVVDSKGKPLVVYHGTRQTFNEFDMSKAPDGGMWFTGDREHAEFFGDAGEYYLSMENPMRLSQDDLENRMDVHYPDGADDGDYGDTLPRDYVYEFAQEAREAGHDGLIIEDFADIEKEGTVYLAFSPTQIKSATDNVGTFDPGNPDIRFHPGDKAAPIPKITQGEKVKRARAQISQYGRLPTGAVLTPLLIESPGRWVWDKEKGKNVWKTTDKVVQAGQGKASDINKNYLTLPNIAIRKDKSSIANKDLTTAAQKTPKKLQESLEKIKAGVALVESDPARFVHPVGYVEAMKTAGVSGHVLVPPIGLKTLLDSPRQYLDMLQGGFHGNKTVSGIKEAAIQGLDGVMEMRQVIGRQPPDLVTALHHFWGTLSKQLPPISQESAWLRLITRPEIMEQIDLSLQGKYKLNPEQWKDLVDKAMNATQGDYQALGNNAKSNANSFHLMLDRHNGRWNEVSKVYDNTDPVQMRYDFASLGHGPVGIKNKVQSFIGLTFGIPGTVLDRWRYVDLFMPWAMDLTNVSSARDYLGYTGANKTTPEDGGGIYKIYGTTESNSQTLSLAFYNMMDRVAQVAIDNSPELKKYMGKHANPGGLHWITWNAIKNEAVGHSSLDLTKDFLKQYGPNGSAADFSRFLQGSRAFVEGANGAQTMRLDYDKGTFKVTEIK